jgi:hypothetical protein
MHFQVIHTFEKHQKTEANVLSNIHHFTILTFLSCLFTKHYLVNARPLVHTALWINLFFLKCKTNLGIANMFSRREKNLIMNLKFVAYWMIIYWIDLGQSRLTTQTYDLSYETMIIT